MIGYFGPFQGYIETASHLEIRGRGTWRSRCGGHAVASVSHGAMAMQTAEGPSLAMPRTGRLTAPRTKSPEQRRAEDQSEAAHFSQPTQSGRGSGNGRPAPPRPPPTFSGDAPGLKVASGPDTAASIDLDDPSTTHHPPAATRRISRNRPVITPQRFCRRSLSSQLSIQSLPPSPRPDPRPHPGTSTSQAIDISQDGTAADRILSRRDPYLRQLPLWPLKF